MKQQKKKYEYISTILAFALIPISGFAIDVYIPSFPQMMVDLHTSAANVKLTMTVFLISYGVSQLFVGMISDSYGRYKMNIGALGLFILTSLAIALAKDISVIIFLRFIQGITISVVVICKRALFVDIYEGEKRKHYTSLVTVVWSTAPILAPFFGGYLQKGFGWRANFYFLAIYGLIMLLLELKFSGETLVKRQKFSLKNIFHVYGELLSASDFSIGIFILGFSYSMVMVFGMSIPFIVERQFNLSAVTTGYCALASGVSIFLGGLFSKMMMDKPFFRKLLLANYFQLVLSMVMLGTALYFHNLYVILCFVMLIHFWEGLTYNAYFTYSLVRFPQYAATSSGLVSGGSYMVFSIMSYAVVSLLPITNQYSLAEAYLVFTAIISVLLLFLGKVLKAQKVAVNM